MLKETPNQTLHYTLLTSIILMAAHKLTLIGSGFLALPDEIRYVAAIDALQYLSKLKIIPAIDALFSTQARPAETLVKMIPAAVQYASSKVMHLNLSESRNTYPIFVFNFIIYCCILRYHFNISNILLKDRLWALVSVLFFSALTNSYLYLRHALPYDESLLIFLIIIYKVLIYNEKKQLSFKKSFVLGFFAFFGYMVYPGYFPLYIASAGLFFFLALDKNNVLNKVYQASYYTLGSLFCLGVFEGLSRIAGGSYLADAQAITGLITQGSFEESFSFIVKYLYEVEGVMGIILMVGMSLFGYILMRSFKKNMQHEPLFLLATLLVFLYFSYTSAGYFFHKMIMYGRLLHQYMPFICTFSVFAFNGLCVFLASKMPSFPKKEVILCVVSLVFILNFGINFRAFTDFAYPRDVAWALSEKYQLKDVQDICEHGDCWALMPVEEDKILRGVGRRNPAVSDVLLLNACYFYPFEDMTKYNPYTPNTAYKLVAAQRHFVNCKAYQYEGASITERQNFDKINFYIKTFVRL
jgi:hypothetical protein